MDIIDAAEHWQLGEQADEGQFSHTVVIATDTDGKVYITQSQERQHQIEPNSLQQWTEIPVQHIYPDWLPTVTIHQPTRALPVYIKRPRFAAYDGSQILADSLLKEAMIHETLGLHGSPFIAQYYGCVVSNGRITGLALARYSQTLDARMKLGFGIAEATKWYDQIRRGVALIHQCGLAHNGLNPWNIMISDEDAVIADFESCCPIGETIFKSGTHGSHGEEAVISAPGNDMVGLNKLGDVLGIPVP